MGVVNQSMLHAHQILQEKSVLLVSAEKASQNIKYSWEVGGAINFKKHYKKNLLFKHHYTA